MVLVNVRKKEYEPLEPLNGGEKKRN